MTKSSVPPRPRGRTVQRRPNRRWYWIVGLVAIVALIGVSAAINLGVGSSGIQGVVTFPDVPAGHSSEPQTYPQTPPIGGVHAPAWQNCGIYAEPVPNEAGVHSLEHGAVWITYRPELPVAEIEQLRSTVRGQRFALLSPYAGLPAPVVASAWGVQITAERAGDPRLAQFVTTYAQGQQAPEPGAPCTGGVGVPTGR